MSRVRWTALLPVLLLLVCCYMEARAAADAKAPQKKATPKSKRKLTRSDGHRWDRLAEIVKVEINSATRKFLQDREHSLIIPLEVDLLMLGFDQDGGYQYFLEGRELEDVLGNMHGQRDICPTVWQTGEPAAVCFNVNYVGLSPPENGIKNVERAMSKAMKHKGSRSYDYLGDGQWGLHHQEAVYDVAADGAVEDALYEVLIQAYQEDNIALPSGLKDSQELAAHRMAIIIINPHKMRMSPLLDEAAREQHEAWHMDIVASWKEGHISREELAQHEAGYSYRYSYMNRGAAASFVSRHNFVVIDVSAGPVSFGPQTSPGGQVEPPAMPRILPILLHMAAELQSTTDHVGTLWTTMIENAEEGCHMLLVGQLAAAVFSATRHLFCPDLQFERVEHARNVLVPLIALYDSESANPTAEDMRPYRKVSLPHVQNALDQLLDSGQEGFIETRSQPLNDFPAIAAAIHKSKVSRSDAVLSSEAGVGLHKTHREYLDADVLLRELLMAVPELSDGTLDVVDDEDRWVTEWHGLADHARHQGTRVVPVFVITLTYAPEQMMLNNRQLVAANHDAVLVLQLVKEADDNTPSDEGLVMSGHVVDGTNLRIDAAGGVTSNIVAGLAMSLAGMVPTYERHDSWEGSVVQDWRWSVGAMPWAPHAHCTQLSGVLVATAHRNFFISHLEVVIRHVQKRLEKLDALVASRLTDPFAYLFDPALETNKPQDLADPKYQAHAQKVLNPKQHLDMLTGLSAKSGYNATFPATTLEQMSTNIDAVHEKLQLVAWSLWSSSWDDAQTHLIELMAAADIFIKHADRDLEAAEDAAACCSLHHYTAVRVEVLAVVVGGVFLVAIALIVTAICLQPSRGGRRGQSSMARQRSGQPSGGGAMRGPGSSSFEKMSGFDGYGYNSSPNLNRAASGSQGSLSDAGVTRSLSRQLSNTLTAATKVFSKTNSRESLPMFEKKKGGKDDKFIV